MRYISTPYSHCWGRGLPTPSQYATTLGPPARLAYRCSAKANFNTNLVFPIPPSDDVLLFSDGSKSRGKVEAAFVHLHPTGSIIASHLLPQPSYMSVFDAELYAASCALQYAAGLPHSTSASTARRP